MELGLNFIELNYSVSFSDIEMKTITKFEGNELESSTRILLLN